MPLMPSRTFTINTPLDPLCTQLDAHTREEHLRRGVMSEYALTHWTPHNSACTLMCCCIPDSMWLCTLHDTVLPPASTPLHVLCICLFSSFIYWRHVLLVCLFIFLSSLLPLFVRQQANIKSDYACHIRRGLGRRLRSSLLLNSSPRCDLPCRIIYAY